MHISLTGNIGGIETFLLNLYHHIDRAKFQFDFISSAEHPAYEDQFWHLGAHLFTLPAGYGHPIRYCRGLAKILRTGGYQIVHIHKNSAADLLPFFVCKKLKIKTVVAHAHSTRAKSWIASHVLHRINKHILPFLYSDAFACSRPAAEWLFPRSEMGKVKIIKNGINTQAYRFRPEIREEVRRRMKLDGRYVIGHVGRFVKEKNHAFLLDVFAEIRRRDPRAVLMLIGTGSLLPEIKEKAACLGIKESVIFTGVRSDVPELMQAMDVFAFPSFYEGLGIALIEAQATGLPCIVSDTVPREADITELVERLPLSSTREWAEQIMRFKQGFQRKSTTEQIKRAGFDIRDTAQKLERFYLKAYENNK